MAVFKGISGVFRNDENLVFRQPDILFFKPEQNVTFQHKNDQHKTGEIFGIPVFPHPDFLFHAERIKRKGSPRMDIPGFAPFADVLVVL